MKTSTALFIYVLALIAGCKKIGSSTENIASRNSTDIPSTNTNLSLQEGLICEPTNLDLLQIVLSGSGATVQVDSLTYKFPSYAAPINSSGILEFVSMQSFTDFSTAVSILEDLWEYSNVDYEAASDEIYHLGEEPLNAIDSALNFSSLRYKYELYYYYDHNWADTVSINVDDDKYANVLNTDHEVKVGNKYYKFVSHNIVAIIDNSNEEALKEVRIGGLLSGNPDITYFNEETSQFENPQRLSSEAEIQGCNNFDMAIAANNLTPTSTSNQWEMN